MKNIIFNKRVFQYEIQKNRKECTRLAAASNKVYQWFSPGTPASSTTKTGRHDIAEILLKVALKHQKSKIFQLYRSHVVDINIFVQVYDKLSLWMNLK
jgi:hypothetical protein